MSSVFVEIFFGLHLHFSPVCEFLMKKLLFLKTMISGQVFSFVKNLILFLIDRLHKEWEYMFGNGSSCNSGAPQLRFSREKASERGDLYAKQLIENIIDDRASKYDPYALDGNTTISCGPSSIVLAKARVTGLSSLHRTNICTLTEEGNRTFMKANLGAGPLTYQRQIVIKFGDFERKGCVLVSLIGIKVLVDFSVEKETGRNGILLNFAINELNGFKLSVNGFGYFDWVINSLFNFLTFFLGRIIRNLLENELGQYILNRLPKYQFPVEGTSYRNVAFNDRHKCVSSNKESPLESFYMKRSHKAPKWSRMFPIGKSSIHRHNSAEYGTLRDFESNSEIMRTFRCSPECNKRTTEMNSVDLPTQSFDLWDGSLNKSYCNEILKRKSESLDSVSELSRLSRKISKLSVALNIVKRKLDWIKHTPSPKFKEMILKNCFQILEDFSSLDRNIPSEFNDIEEMVYNSNARRDSVTSPPSRGFENEESLLNYEKQVKKSKLEDVSLQEGMSEGSSRDKLEWATEVVNENLKQSKLLEEIFSEIHDHSCKNAGNAFDMEIKMPNRVANCDSFPSTKSKSPQIDENILESSITETGTLNLTRSCDTERRKAQIDYLKKMFNGKKRKGITEDSNENRHISVEARNLSKLSGTEMYRNASLGTCTVEELEKRVKVFLSGLSGEYKSQTEDTEYIKSPETQCSSNPDQKDVGRNNFSSNIAFDTMRQAIQDEKNFDLEEDTEKISTNLHHSEMKGNEEKDKIPFNYVNAYTGEEKLNEHSQRKVDEGYSADNSSNSEELIDFDFPAKSFGICSRPFEKNSYKVLKNETEGKCDIFSKTRIFPEHLSKMREKLDSMNKVTTSWLKETSLLGELACSNARDTEYPDSSTECSSVAVMVLNSNSNRNTLGETQHPKPLHDVLQEEIIVKTRKMLSDVVSSDPEENEY